MKLRYWLVVCFTVPVFIFLASISVLRSFENLSEKEQGVVEIAKKKNRSIGAKKEKRVKSIKK